MNLLKLPKNYLSFFFLMLFAYLSLWYEYIHTFNFWGYMGFDLDFMPLRSIVSWLLFIICTHLILTMREMFFKTIVVFLFVYMAIPSMIYFQYNPSINFSAIGGSLILIACFYLSSFIKIKLKPVTIGGNFSNFYIYCFLFISLIPYLIYYPLPDLSFSSNFYADIIYQVRTQYRSVEGPAFLSYYYGALSRVILPFLIVFSLSTKKYSLFIICITIALYLFSLGALKSIIFGILLTVIFFFGKDFETKIYMILFGIIGLCFFSILETYLFNTYAINDNFVRRVFYLPVLLHEIYSNYFGTNYQYWSHTFIGQTLGFYDLNQSLTFFVGENIMGLEGANANVGVMTEGYFSAGYLGVFLQSTMIAIIFLIVRAVGISSAYIGVLLYFCYLINTSFLFPLLATHGMLALLILCLLRFRNLNILRQ